MNLYPKRMHNNNRLLLFDLFKTKINLLLKRRFNKYYSTLSVKEKITFLTLLYSLLLPSKLIPQIKIQIVKFINEKTKIDYPVNIDNNIQSASFSNKLSRIVSLFDILNDITRCSPSVKFPYNKYAFHNIAKSNNKLFLEKVINKNLEFILPEKPIWVTETDKLSTCFVPNDYVSILGLFHFYDIENISNPRTLCRMDYNFSHGKLYKPNCLNRIGYLWWPSTNKNYGKTLNLKQYIISMEENNNNKYVDGVPELLHDFENHIFDKSSKPYCSILGTPNVGYINWEKIVSHHEALIEEVIYVK
jgi:hypothetical protein